MYRYDSLDQRIVDERVEQYRDQTRRYLAGELGEAEFLPLRLKNGLYLQRLAPMLRVAIPYGTLAATQMRMLAHIARHYDKGYGHFTTRQNVQFNWVRLEEVPDILADLARVQMHAIQTSGSCIRNVTADPLSGAAGDERIDARPWCELLRQWSTGHPEFGWLPRKFKIAVNGAHQDRSAIRLHDIGIDVRRAGAAVLFDIWAGGGLGRTPVIGTLLREGLPARHLLTYIEAILRVYNRYGRRDNKYKARIKILLRAMGAEGFRERVEAEFAALEDGPGTLSDAEIQRVHAAFHLPSLVPAPDRPAELTAALEDPAFSAWYQRNVRPHRTPGHAGVLFTLKRAQFAPGDATDADMDAVADWADAWSGGEIRVTKEQNLLLPHVRQRDLPELWQAARARGLARGDAGTLADLVCCPGGDFCSLANAKSIPVAQAIQRRFADLDELHDLGDLRLNISGCMNACGHHHIGHIGILGVDKKGAEYYQVAIGGDGGEDAAIATILGPSFDRDSIVDVVEQLMAVYIEARTPGESFLACVRRIGVEPFRERIYAQDHR